MQKTCILDVFAVGRKIQIRLSIVTIVTNLTISVHRDRKNYSVV